jgi:hypothetical protein
MTCKIDIFRSSNHILHVTTELFKLFEIFSFNSISNRFQVTVIRFDSVLKLLYFGSSRLNLKSKWSVSISKNLIRKPSRFKQYSVWYHIWGLVITFCMSQPNFSNFSKPFGFNSISDQFQGTVFWFDLVSKLLYFGLSRLSLKSKWSVLILKNLIWKPSWFEQCLVRCHVWLADMASNWVELRSGTFWIDSINPKNISSQASAVQKSDCLDNIPFDSRLNFGLKYLNS